MSTNSVSTSASVSSASVSLPAALRAALGLPSEPRSCGARRCVSFAASDALASGAVAGVIPSLVVARNFGASPWLRPSPLERAGFPSGELGEVTEFGAYGRRVSWSGADAVAVLSAVVGAGVVSRSLFEWEVDAEDLEVSFSAVQDLDAQCPLTEWEPGFNVAVVPGGRYDGVPREWSVTGFEGGDFEGVDVVELLEGADDWSGSRYSQEAVVRWLSSQGVRGIVGASVCEHSGRWIGDVYAFDGSTDSAREVVRREFFGFVTPDQIRSEFALLYCGGVEFDPARGWFSVGSGVSVDAEVSAWASERVGGFFSGPLDDYVRGDVFVVAAEIEAGSLSGESSLGGVFGDDAVAFDASYGSVTATSYVVGEIGEAWAWVEREAARVAPPEYVI